MVEKISEFFDKIVANINADAVLFISLGILAAVFLLFVFLSRYPARFIDETENVLQAMRDNPEDTGLLDVHMARFPGDIAEMWKKYRSGGVADVGLYIDQNLCVETPTAGRATRVIVMGLVSVLVAAIALALGAAINGFVFTGVFPAIIALLAGAAFMTALHYIFARRYKNVLKSFYALIDILSLNLPRKGMLFLPGADGAEPAAEYRKPARRAEAPESVKETQSPVKTDESEIRISGAGDERGDYAEIGGTDPEKEDIVEKIDRAISEDASKQTMLEIAKLLSAERKKPENQKPVQQKRLNDALAKLLKAMSAKK